MINMTVRRSSKLFEVGSDARTDPFEDQGLGRRTDFQSRAPRAGADFKEMALHRVAEAGAKIERRGFEIDDIPIDAEVRGHNGRSFLVLARGTPDEHPQSGVRKTDTLEKVGFRAIQLARCQALPVFLITSDLPDRSSKAGRYLAKLNNDVWDVVSVRADLRGFLRMKRAFDGPSDAAPPEAPWRGPLGDAAPTLFDAAPDDRRGQSPIEHAVNDGRRTPEPRVPE